MSFYKWFFTSVNPKNRAQSKHYHQKAQNAKSPQPAGWAGRGRWGALFDQDAVYQAAHVVPGIFFAFKAIDVQLAAGTAPGVVVPVSLLLGLLRG